MASPYPVLDDISHIAGNAPDNVKRLVGDPKTFFTSQTPGGSSGHPIFGEAIQRRLSAIEMSINKKAEEPKKTEARYVMEIEVAEDMLNGGGNIHGGCSAFLVDVCSSMALVAHTYVTTGKLQPSVSQSLNLVYHSPATIGDKLRIVNTTLSLGARAQSARTEIWNVTHGRLVVSATHIKMHPSPPKANL
ncbi:HotDog domain-containing protein [Panaeolus papilionaceus]|nr:HotDog domain-containing protein [Panaeolus papilionaceus]